MMPRSASRSCHHLMSATPAARAFFQLATHRALASNPVLDFLAPSTPRHISQNAFKQLLRPVGPKRGVSVRRAFSTTSSRAATTAIYNPKQDDDGLDMNIEITPRASNRLKQIMVKDSNPNLALRITVESGGCHGFQYLMSLTTLPSPLSVTPVQEDPLPLLNTSVINPIALPTVSPKAGEKQTAQPALDEDDTVFEADDGSEAKVVMDGPSLELLKGSKIDFTMELIGSQFKIVDNPLATSSCGCGTSFDIKG